VRPTRRHNVIFNLRPDALQEAQVLLPNHFQLACGQSYARRGLCNNIQIIKHKFTFQVLKQLNLRIIVAQKLPK